MEKKITFKNNPEKIEINKLITLDELANLKKISDIDNSVSCQFNDLKISTANEVHIKEVAELWANLASIQQIFAPERYDYKYEGKNWQEFVKRKLSKKQNLLLVAYKNDCFEVMGFLYLQTITIPSTDLVVKGAIEDIYTKPQYRKQGIASKLLDVGLDWVQKQNIKHVDFVLLMKARNLLEFSLKYIKRSNTEVKLDMVTV